MTRLLRYRQLRLVYLPRHQAPPPPDPVKPGFSRIPQELGLQLRTPLDRCKCFRNILVNLSSVST